MLFAGDGIQWGLGLVRPEGDGPKPQTAFMTLPLRPLRGILLVFHLLPWAAWAQNVISVNFVGGNGGNGNGGGAAVVTGVAGEV